MAWARAGVVLVAVTLGALALSGGRRDDPDTPTGLPGLPPPFLGVAVIGSGGRTAAVDAYGDVVDLRAPGPARPALVAVPAARQAAGTVPESDARVARVRLRDGRSVPLWRADAVRQRYLPGTNVLQTTARFGDEQVIVVRRIGRQATAAADRRWLARARPLGEKAPRWAQAMYRRSLLVLRALTDRHTGAVAAGARDGWAYVWPRDAATAAMAFAAAGYMPEARRVTRFLTGLDLTGAARFDGSGAPVPGRGAQGDAAGWVAAAERAVGLPERARPHAWQGRADYQEGDPGDYLGNAISSRVSAHDVREHFGSAGGLVRVAGDHGSGFDSAAAWAVRPFPQPALFPAVRRTLLRLAAHSGRFGIVPSENWHGGDDPWTAPTAWTAWALAGLWRAERDGGQPHAAWVDRRKSLRLIAGLRRAATPLGLLPERVGARSGLPTSTTPLAWSHAFAILALQELWS